MVPIEVDAEPKTKNSMLYWYPKLAEIDVPLPDTVFVPLEHDGKSGVDCPVSWDNDQVRDAVDQVGGPPAFVRTDVASYKHRMEDASKLPATDDDTINDHLFELISFNEMAQLTGLPYQVLVVREWLDLLHMFKAFKGTPIAREVRSFIKDGEGVCSHFYWPKDALKFYGDEPDEWETEYDLLLAGTHAVIDEFRPIVEDVAEAFTDDSWSVDLAQAEDGSWYVIDMALAPDSWHPDCPEMDSLNSERSEEAAVSDLLDLGPGDNAGKQLHTMLLQKSKAFLEQRDEVVRVNLLHQDPGTEQPDGEIVTTAGVSNLEAEVSTLSKPGKVLQNAVRALQQGRKVVFVTEEPAAPRLVSILEDPVREDGSPYTLDGDPVQVASLLDDLEYRILVHTVNGNIRYRGDTEEVECPELDDDSERSELEAFCLYREEDGTCELLDQPCILQEEA